MTLLLQFDFFYTIIRISCEAIDLVELEKDFMSWLYTSESNCCISDDGIFYLNYNDKTFIDWMAKYKFPNESIEILEHMDGIFNNSCSVDGKIFF